MTRWITTIAIGTLMTTGFAGRPALAQEKAAADKPKIADLEYVSFKTSMGEIVIELNRAKAPITVENFLQYVDDSFFDGTIFHRVMPGFVIQGGGFDKQINKKPVRPGIKNEWQNGLKNLRGTLSMARLGGQADSGTSQFFVNLVDNSSLDQNRDGAAYAVFARVIRGMDVVDKIAAVNTQRLPTGMGDVPVEPIEVALAARLSDEQAKPLREAAKKKAEQEKKKRMAAFQKTLDEATSFLKTREVDVTKAEVSDSGLWHIDVTEGSGPSPASSQRVSVHYTGWLTNGKEFDSSHKRGRPAEFVLNQVIAGWIEGVGGMKVGGKRYLIIPGNLAYRDRGSPPLIGPNATLVFEIDLLEIK